MDKRIIFSAKDAAAYIAGRKAWINGEAGRITNPYTFGTTSYYAWALGFLDAVDADDGEEPQPETAGYK